MSQATAFASPAASADAASADDRPWPLPWLALLTALWLGWTTGWRHIAVPDEGRYAGVAWEMIRSGDWLTPTLNGLPFFHKPPLFYWLTAGSIELFGQHPWSGRLASVFGAWLGAMALFLFLRRWSSLRHAQASVLALVTMPYWFGGAQYANLDMLVGGCITATIAMGAHACLLHQAGLPHHRALWGTWALAALGLLAKGLIGFVLPGGVLGLWLLLRGQWRTLLALFSLPGMVLFGLIGAPWFVAMQHRYPDFFHYFFVYQHFQRFTQTGFNNMHPMWWYVPVIVLLTLPWLPVAGWLGRRGAQQGGAVAVAPPQVPAAVKGLLWCWGLLILVFFSLPASKLAGYVLPVLPALAAGLAGWGLSRIGAQAWRRLAVGAAALSLTVIATLRHFDNRAAHALVAPMRAALQGDAQLVYVESFAYDLPFLLGLREPVPLFTDWDAPELPKRDNDLKELTDAAAFNRERGQRLLLPRSLWDQALCRHARTVVVGPPDAVRQYAQLAATPPTIQVKYWALWVLDRDTLRQRGLACTPLAQQGLAGL